MRQILTVAGIAIAASVVGVGAYASQSSTSPPTTPVSVTTDDSARAEQHQQALDSRAAVLIETILDVGRFHERAVGRQIQLQADQAAQSRDVSCT